MGSKTSLTLIAAAALSLAATSAVFAQSGRSGAPGAFGGQSNTGTTMPGNRNGNTGSTQGPGASEFAPGRNPGTANETNPGHGGTPPGQRMQNPGSNTRPNTR